MTPLAALFLMGLGATCLILGNDISALLNYFGFANWSIYGASFAGVIILRRKTDKSDTTFSVPIVLPWIMIMFSLYLAVNPFYVVSKFDFSLGSIIQIWQTPFASRLQL